MRIADLSLDTVTLEQDGRVLTARYTGSPHNFVTTAFMRDWDRLTKAADRDHTVGAVVLTGGPEHRFLTHADPRELGGMAETPHPFLPAWLMRPALASFDAALRLPVLIPFVERFGGALGVGLVWGHRWKKTILRMNRSSVVYLAAINGPTLGGGHEIALACDLRYAADDDHVQLGQIETLACLIPGGGGTQRLPRMIGTAKALELTLEGAPVSAREARELGLVHRLVDPERLVPAAQETAARLAARNPVAIAALKRSIYFATSKPLPAGLAAELAYFISAGSTKAARRTTRSFLEDLDKLGDTPFLADPAPWINGTRVDQTS